MLNSDLHLKNEAGSKRSRTAKNDYDSEDSDDGGFHFIAFVPVEGKVWKFDGLERQPQDLGMYGINVANPLAANRWPRRILARRLARPGKT